MRKSRSNTQMTKATATAPKSTIEPRERAAVRRLACGLPQVWGRNAHSAVFSRFTVVTDHANPLRQAYPYGTYAGSV